MNEPTNQRSPHSVNPSEEATKDRLEQLRAMLRQLAAWRIHHHCCGELDYDAQWHEQVAAINELAKLVANDLDVQSDASSLWRSLDALDDLLSRVDSAIESRQRS